MSSRVERVSAYKAQIEAFNSQLSILNRKYNVMAYARMLVFAMGIGLGYLFFQWNFWLGFLGSIGLLLGFFYLIKIHIQYSDKRDHLKRMVEINESETKVLNGDWKHLEDGKSFVNSAHAFSFDLDLFGRASVFQYLNRTGTAKGRELLASWLRKPSEEKQEIQQRQETANEISKKIDWNLNFQAMGMGQMESEEDSESILAWLGETAYFSTHAWYPKLIWILPSLFVITLLGWIVPDVPIWKGTFGDFHLPGSIPLFFFLLQLAVVGLNLGRTANQQVQVGKKSRLLKKYASLLKEVEQETFSTEWMTSRQHLLEKGGFKGSEAVARLGELTDMLDQRLNALAGLLLNGIMMWDLQYMIRLEKWKETYKTEVPVWFQVIAEVDAMVSIARYHFNHPEHIIPEILDGPFQLNAEGLGHPLMDPTVRIDNDMSLAKPGEFLIITGANMAGKSTFLRTVGVNLVLAMVGAPVCADKYSFVPVPMMTSVRVTDSLDDNESYFYAELKRLKKIIDQLKSAGTTFIIVDEMLRGTNSKDKQTGSRRFIEQLIRLNGIGLVATHDLSLGTLADEYPEHAFNKRFEVEISDDSLHFDYKLKDGISQNLNATFLMEKMGIMA